MKILPFIFLLFSVSLFCQAQIDTTKRPYQIKYCKITFAFDNGPQKGVKTVIFDDWGQYEKVYGSVESDTAFYKKIMKDSPFPLNNVPQKQNELVINTPTYSFRINPDTKKGVKIAKKKEDDDIRALKEMVNSAMPEKKRIGYEIYLGKNCSVEVIKDFMKMWFWNGFCIKKEVLNTKEFKLEEHAIEIDESYIPSKEDFDPPKDIEIKEY